MSRNKTIFVVVALAVLTVVGVAVFTSGASETVPQSQSTIADNDFVVENGIVVNGLYVMSALDKQGLLTELASYEGEIIEEIESVSDTNYTTFKVLFIDSLSLDDIESIRDDLSNKRDITAELIVLSQ